MFIKIIHKFAGGDSNVEIMDWPWILADANEEFRHAPLSTRCDCESCRGREVEEIIGYPDFLLEWMRKRIPILKLKAEHTLEKIDKYNKILGS